MTRLLSCSSSPVVAQFLSRMLEPRKVKPARVAWVHEDGPRFRRVRFEGTALQGVRFIPGMDVEFRASGRATRRFSPALFDAAAGAMEVVFFVCGEGPGSAWVRSLREGAEVEVLGPGGGLPVDPHARYHAFVGDETSVGLEECLSRSVRDGACWSSVIEASEVPPSRAQWVPRGDPRDETLARFLARQPRSSTFYLAGHPRSIQGLRRRLVALGVPRRLIRTKASFAEGPQAG